MMKKGLILLAILTVICFAVVPALAADAKADTIAEVKSMAVGSRVKVFGEVRERLMENRFVFGDAAGEIARCLWLMTPRSHSASSPQIISRSPVSPKIMTTIGQSG